MIGTITKTCSTCKKALSVELFGDNGKSECYKTCDTCRANNKKYIANQKAKRHVVEETEEYWVEESIFPLGEGYWVDSNDGLLTFRNCGNIDGWALITSDTFDKMTMLERQNISISRETVISSLNLSFIDRLLYRTYICDVGYDTTLNLDSITLEIENREPIHIRYGDTWGGILRHVDNVV